MKNELFTIGPFTVYSYGFMIAVGVFAAWLTAEYRAKKYRADTDQIFFLVLWCLVGGLLGAKLLFWITEWKEVAADPGFILRTMTDGFVVYGGIIGGIIAGWLYSSGSGIWKNRLPSGRLLLRKRNLRMAVHYFS